MGISIIAKYNPKINCSMGYIRFGNIREDIAKAYNKELGDIYSDSFKFLHDKQKFEEIDRRFEELFNKSDERTQTLMKFLSEPDTDGTAPAEACKIIFELKNKVLASNAEYKNYQKMYLEPFFKVIGKGCSSGIKWY